ncbi:uncharacterized protein [Diadema antillarum]|uniref:uncharacterized protein n=1 Tax=Diadema antillarum TaxID=105358 RepID=UPI003A8778AD
MVPLRGLHCMLFIVGGLLFATSAQLSADFVRELSEKVSKSRKGDSERENWITGGANDDFGESDNVADILSGIAGQISNLGRKRGQAVKRGRDIVYETHHRLHSWDDGWVFDCKMKDVVTGTQVEVRHEKRESDAIEKAVEKLFSELGSAVHDGGNVHDDSSQTDHIPDVDTPQTTSSPSDRQPSQPTDDVAPINTQTDPNSRQKDAADGQTLDQSKVADTANQESGQWTFTVYRFFWKYLTVEGGVKEFALFIGSCVIAWLVVRYSKSSKESMHKMVSLARLLAVDIEPDGNGLYEHRFVGTARPTTEQLNPVKFYASLYNSRQKGLVYILNNFLFFKRAPNERSRQRTGSKADVENIKHVFTQLGYEPVIHQDLTADAIRSTLDAFILRINAEGAHRHSSAAVFVMTHGRQDGILGTDENVVTIKEIMARLSGKRCPALIDKPKMVFIQACRGSNVQESAFDGMVYDENIKPRASGDGDAITTDNSANIQYDGHETDQPLVTDGIPDNSDIYVAFATSDGYFSIRHKEKGTWFVQAICEEFLAGSHVDDLDTMMESVTRRVTSLTAQMITETGDVLTMLQTPDIRKQGVRRKIFFAPKYPEV